MLLAYRDPMVFLARHATPDWSRRDIPYDLPPGPPLTAQGEEEARKLGAFLREQGVMTLYASPLERTRRTAELAAEVCGATVVEEHAIAEWRRDEDEATVLARIRPFWERACTESQASGPVALVTHGGCVLALLNHLQVPAGEINHYRNQCDHRNPLPPAAAWLTTRRAGGASFDAGLGAPAWDVRLAFTPQPIQHVLPAIAYV
jgi:broad specificity phosphatase PhoE